MAKWVEIQKNTIPVGKYRAEIRCGEKEGVLICLKSEDNVIRIEFGALSAIRILDEGVVLQKIFDKSEFDKYDETKFSNTIYKVNGGEFGEFVKKTSGETLYDYIGYEHYIIVTLNYYIEVISSREPDIEVRKMSI